MNLEKSLGPEEVQDILGLKDVDTVYRLVAEHGLPSFRIGRLHRFTPDAVAQWIAAGGTAQKEEK